jgi:hypothetical protein
LEDVSGDRRELYHDLLHNLYYTPNIIRMIKLRKMKWAEHEARTKEKRSTYKILVRIPEGKRSLGTYGILLKYMLHK